MIPYLQKTFQVTDAQLDANGHVNNIEYVKWMQDVAVQHADECGLTMDVYRRLSVSWVARTHHIDYLQSAFLDDAVVATTWLASAKRVSCLRRYRFTRNRPDGDLLATAETHWVYVDATSGRPKRVDRQVIEMFQMLGDEPDFV